MWLDKLYIYGFGKWVDKQFTFPSAGIVEISGDNEAGKTTIRQCILYILFGMTAKQVEAFVPRKGGTVGGKMVLSGLDEQSVTIERIHGKNKNQAIIYLDNGSQQSEKWLYRKLQHLDRSQYQEVYTFDANDLQKIQHLDNEALNEVLLAIGMMGTDRIYYAERTLEKKRTELFNPFGKKPVINQYFQQLQSLHDQLRTAQKKENSYHLYLQEIERLEEEAERLDAEKITLERQLNDVEKHLSHYAVIRDFYMTNAQLKRLDTAIVFPSDGLSRLQGWKEALLPLQSEENVLINNIKEVEKEIANTSPLSDEEIDKLEEALHIIEEINQLSTEIDQFIDKRNTIETDIQSKLKAMQLAITVEELKELELPFYLEEYWSDLASQTEKLTMEIRYIENDFDSLKKVKETLQRNKQEEEDRLIKEEIIHRYQQDVEKDKENQNAQKQQTVWYKWTKQYQKRLQLSNGLGLVLLLVSIVLFFIAEISWPIVVLFIAVLQNILVRFYGKAVTKWLQPRSTQTEAFTTEDIQKRKQVIQEQTMLRNKVAEAEKDLQHHQMEQLKIEEKLNFLNERKGQLQLKIMEQTDSYPFLSKVALAYWARMYQQLLTLKERLAECFQLDENILNKERDKKKKEADLEAFKWKDKDQLSSIIQQEKENTRAHSQLIARKEDLQAQLQTILEKKKPYQQEIHQLLQNATVETEEEFIEKGEQFSTIQHLKQKYVRLYDSLIVFFSDGQIEEIKKGQFDSLEVLEKQLHDKKQRLQELNEKYKSKIAQISDIKANVALLERNEDVSVWKHQLAIKQMELEETAKQWSIYQLAAEALKKAKISYSHKYLPQVFEQAGIYFKRLTIDRYIRIYKNENEQLLVKDKEGFSFQVNELSQATKDQLYIAIRFALSKVMASRIALPFLIDDGFVHFDEHRKEKILELLEEISRDHQVFYFTAHATAENILRLSQC